LLYVFVYVSTTDVKPSCILMTVVLALTLTLSGSQWPYFTNVYASLIQYVRVSMYMYYQTCFVSRNGHIWANVTDVITGNYNRLKLDRRIMWKQGLNYIGLEINKQPD
jgi:hypothetical protein